MPAESPKPGPRLTWAKSYAHRKSVEGLLVVDEGGFCPCPVLPLGKGRGSLTGRSCLGSKWVPGLGGS